MKTWVCAILLALVTGPFINRWIWLSQMPDVVLPFDVEEVVEPESNDEAALDVYANVLKMLANPQSARAKQAPSITATDPQDRFEQYLKQMADDDEQALAEYLRAGNLERSGGISIKSMTWNTNLDQYQSLRQLMRVYMSVASNLEASGELDKAWAVHRANFQLSLHSDRNSIAICKLIGIAIRAMGGEGFVSWSSNPAVTAEQLRAARAELSRLYQRRGSVSDCYKAEYLVSERTLREPEGILAWFQNFSGPTDSKPMRYAKRALLWFCGQPDTALRAWRQMLVNNVSEVNKPVTERRVIWENVDNYVFELSEQTSRAPGQLDGATLARKMQLQHPVVFQMMPALKDLDLAMQRDLSRYHLIMIAFAAQEFRRHHGHFPEVIAELVPVYLDTVPVDSMHAQGALLNYRRNSDGTAVTWSVGPNGVDDHGAINATPMLDVGYKIHFNLPTNPGPTDADAPD